MDGLKFANLGTSGTPEGSPRAAQLLVVLAKAEQAVTAITHLYVCNPGFGRTFGGHIQEPHGLRIGELFWHILGNHEYRSEILLLL